MQKIHPETGEILHRDIRPVEYTYKGEKITVNQPGWYPDEGDDGILTREDCKIADNALTILKARHEEKISAAVRQSAPLNSFFEVVK